MLPSLSLESHVPMLGVLQGVSQTFNCFLGFHFGSGWVEWQWICSNLICSCQLANFELNASFGRLNFEQISITYVYAYGHFYSSTNMQALGRLWAADTFWTQLDFWIFANKIVIILHICNYSFVSEWFTWGLNKGPWLGAVVPGRACGSNG